MQLIPIVDLVEPEHAARTEMGDAALESLSRSIAELGVLEPLIVRPSTDGRFEIVAGHRRFLAARMAELSEVPCLVEEDDDRADAIKIHENIEREDLNPADEAIFYGELYEKMGEDVDAVAERVKQTRGYVEGRLLLLSGYESVLEALRAGKVSLGAAQELNRMKRAEDAVWYLEHTIKSGASVRLVRQWRSEANARVQWGHHPQSGDVEGAEGESPQPDNPASAPSYAGYATPDELSASKEQRHCLFCDEEHQEWQMYRKFICAPCAGRFLTPEMLAELRHHLILLVRDA